jgi:hypothetical protein
MEIVFWRLNWMLMSYNNSGVAAVVSFSLLQVFRIPYTHGSAFFFTQNAHSTCSRPNGRTLSGYSSVRVVGPIEWSHKFCKLLRSTKNACRGCSMCRGFRTDVGCCEMTVFRTGFIFNYLFTDKAMAIQFMKEVGLFRSKVQCNTCGQDMTCPQIPFFLKDFVGHVKRG